MIGKLLDGRYRITEVLGSGAFGQTYLAEDTRRPGNPQCVVKQLCPTNNGSKSLQAAHRLFKREAETLEKLGRHNKIPQLLAYFAENQRFYLVKEFTQGHPVTQEIVAGVPLSEEQVAGILVEVLEILVFVHGNRVIHRDIKPANLIRRAGDNRLVLIDFGSVKEITAQIAQGQGPWTIAAGTPAYMPVEQFQGNPQFNSDIYALGMIAVQALTGLPATDLPKLQDPNTGKITWRHRAIVSSQLADIIDKMVHHHYGQRYQSAAAVLAHLNKLPTLSQLPPPPETIVTQNDPPLRQLPLNRSILAAIVAFVVLSGLFLLSLRPDTTKSQGFYTRGLKRAESGDQEGAIAEYTRAIQFNRNNAEAYYKRGNAYYDLGELDKAIEDYDEAIERNPNYADAYYNRGLAQYDRGNQRGAIEDFNEVIRLHPQDSGAYYKRGIAYFDLKDYRTAIQDYTEAIRLNPDDAKAYQARGIARLATDNKQPALEDHTKAILLAPDDADAYYSRGRARFFLADYQGAVEDYTEAIGRNPKQAQAYSNRCGAYLNLGQHGKAIADCTEAIKLNPNDEVAYDNRCIAQHNAGQYKQAIEDCSQAIRINAGNPKAYSNRGLAKAAAGDSAGAIEDYTQAIRLNPSDSVAYSNRAVAQSKRGNYAGAIADYAQALRLSPTFAGAYLGRGLARAQMGDRAGAIEDVQKAATLYLEQGRPSEYKEAQQQLNKLRQ
ncbi:tetratricopeptide repeat protein [Microcoleus sp. FACHB-68]|uniref:tetratricopeptide repeat protein n=1 Tax=Microcoleus sp. FACHB-68 TaxID=2692826 RepID=UPI00168778FD|nr:tetratricopeptide repeat protein [Microcoleus sp. FACHB-68]